MRGLVNITEVCKVLSTLESYTGIDLYPNDVYISSIPDSTLVGPNPIRHLG